MKVLTCMLITGTVHTQYVCMHEYATVFFKRLNMLMCSVETYDTEIICLHTTYTRTTNPVIFTYYMPPGPGVYCTQCIDHNLSNL